MDKNLSRRNWIKGIGAGALTAAFGTQLRVAQAQDGMAQALAFHRFPLGSFEVTIVRDAILELNPSIFGGNVSETAGADALAAANLPTDMIPGTVNLLMVNTGSNIVLFDTGFGMDNPNGGRLAPTLEMMGMSAEDIDTVVISHFHPDHISGVSNEGTIAFPNATYYYNQVEWDLVSAGPQGNGLDGIIEAATGKIGPVADADQLSLFNYEDEIVSGIQAVAAPGHTPAHTAFLIESEGNQMMNLVDSVLHHVITLQNPTYHAAFDGIPDQAVESRISILGRVADNQIYTFGYHFPFPGVGYVSRNGESFLFTSSL